MLPMGSQQGIAVLHAAQPLFLMLAMLRQLQPHASAEARATMMR
jgi:hypothetical protein